MSECWQSSREEFSRGGDESKSWRVATKDRTVVLSRGKESLAWKIVRYTPASGSVETFPPKALGAFVQEPALVVPTEPVAGVGLEVTARFLPDGNGFLAEFRAQTVLPITGLQLVLELTFPPGVEVASLPLASTLEPTRGESLPADEAAWIQLSGALDMSTIFLDAGEDGTVTLNRSSDGSLRVEASLFRQTLEKGVILVGRIGRRPGVVGSPPRQIGPEDYRRWRDGVSFL